MGRDCCVIGYFVVVDLGLITVGLITGEDCHVTGYNWIDHGSGLSYDWLQ